MNNMEWENLKEMCCPKCANKLTEVSIGYKCTSCELFIGYDKFRTVVNNLYKKQPKYYNPDAVDRSDWN